MNLGLGVRKDWQKFIQILNKAIKSIDKQEQQNIMKHWVLEENQKIDLTSNEKKWIENNKQIKYVYSYNFV